MPKSSKNRPPADAELAQKMKLKAVSMKATAGGIFAQTKKPRRSTREIAPKQSRQVRLILEEAAKAVANTLKQQGILSQKLKTLEKLHARHVAAGRSDSASGTQGQIDTLQNEMRLLELDLKALREGPQVAMDDGMADE